MHNIITDLFLASLNIKLLKDLTQLQNKRPHQLKFNKDHEFLMIQFTDFHYGENI